MNNQTAANIDFASIFKFRENMIQIDKLVLTGSPQDEVIHPYQSAFFEFWYENSVTKQLEMVPMEQQTIYTNDVFGLKTLDKEGRLIRTQVPNVHHDDWVHNETLYKLYMEPHLY